MTYAVKEIFYTLQGEGANVGRPAVFCRFAGCNLWTGLEKDRSSAVCQFCDTDFVGTDGPGGGKFNSAADLADAVAEKWPNGRGPGSRVQGRVPEARSRKSEFRSQRAQGSESERSTFNVQHSTFNDSDAGITHPSSFISHPLSGPGPSSLVPRPAARPSSLDPRPLRLVVCTGGEPLLQLDEPLVDAFHKRGFEIAIETNGTRQPPQGIDWICVSPKAGAELVLTSGDELKLIYPQPGAEPERYVGLDFQHFFLQPMDGPDLARNVQLTTQYCLEHPFWRLSLQSHKLIGIP